MKRSLRKENAYMTVEAALVFPVVLAVQMMIISLFVFQYDRCLLNQDMGRLLVIGCGAEEQKKDMLSAYIAKCAAELYLEKYVAWDMNELEIELIQDSVAIKGRGRLLMPMFRLSGGGGNALEAAFSYGGERLHHTLFIRQCRKLKGEEDAADGIYQEPELQL